MYQVNQIISLCVAAILPLLARVKEDNVMSRAKIVTEFGNKIKASTGLIPKIVKTFPSL